jgi:hypothetical protein
MGGDFSQNKVRLMTLAGKSPCFYDKLTNLKITKALYSMIGMHTSTTILLLGFLTIFCSCKSDDDQPNLRNAEWECLPGIDENLLKEWKGAPLCNNAQEPHCSGDTCNFLRLQLNADSTYTLIYSLIEPRTTEPDTFELSEVGSFTFDCHRRGIFTTRFTFQFVEGMLTLNPTSALPREFPIRWDGFMGLQFRTNDLGLDFSCNFYLL